MTNSPKSSGTGEQKEKKSGGNDDVGPIKIARHNFRQNWAESFFTVNPRPRDNPHFSPCPASGGCARESLNVTSSALVGPSPAQRAIPDAM